MIRDFSYDVLQSSVDTPSNKSGNEMITWQSIDTVLLDMDGTLLDLKYDNQVWSQLLPQAYAERQGITAKRAGEQLLSHMREILGTMNFYRFDYWREFTGLDIVQLHQQATGLIEFLPDAQAFLKALTRANKGCVVITNADRQSLQVKEPVLQLESQVDRVISSHDYGAPKEEDAFWQALQQDLNFDPARTLFIDDTPRVLAAARKFGIRHLLAVARPDSQQGNRDTLGWPSFEHYRELLDHMP